MRSSLSTQPRILRLSVSVGSRPLNVMSTGICMNSPGCIARATVRHACPHTLAQEARSGGALRAHTRSSRATKINYHLRVFRDDLAAAHSRIESLEREL